MWLTSELFDRYGYIYGELTKMRGPKEHEQHETLF